MYDPYRSCTRTLAFIVHFSRARLHTPHALTLPTLTATCVRSRKYLPSYKSVRCCVCLCTSALSLAMFIWFLRHKDTIQDSTAPPQRDDQAVEPRPRGHRRSGALYTQKHTHRSGHPGLSLWLLARRFGTDLRRARLLTQASQHIATRISGERASVRASERARVDDLRLCLNTVLNSYVSAA